MAKFLTELLCSMGLYHGKFGPTPCTALDISSSSRILQHRYYLAFADPVHGKKNVEFVIGQPNQDHSVRSQNRKRNPQKSFRVL